MDGWTDGGRDGYGRIAEQALAGFKMKRLDDMGYPSRNSHRIEVETLFVLTLSSSSVGPHLQEASYAQGNNNNHRIMVLKGGRGAACTAAMSSSEAASRKEEGRWADSPSRVMAL